MIKVIKGILVCLIVTIIATFAVVAIAGNESPTIVDGRYVIEEENEFVTKFTDLKTNKVQWRTDDGQETDWFDNVTTWEEACTTWDDI